MKKVVLAVLLLTGCYQPSIILSGTTSGAINPEDVKIYNEKNIPQDYEIVGVINVKSDASFGRNSATNRNLKKVKSKAASVGANGLLIGSVSHKTNYWDDSMQMNVTAVRVK